MWVTDRIAGLSGGAGEDTCGIPWIITLRRKYTAVFMVNAEEMGEELHIVIGVRRLWAGCTHSFSSYRPFRSLLLV